LFQLHPFIKSREKSYIEEKTKKQNV